ncbi:FAD-binding oxidoreductase [Erwinia sp. MYb375]|uniref:NAD(P)/FAD-dependent oxidoreductase n=1 Tax=unclassified Erwinia TaxID=2622719 RepID=UPI0030AD14F9
MDIRSLPFDQNINGWAAQLPPLARLPALNRSIQADWLVIGAGYAGLAFARRIAELRPHQQVVVIDAVDIADNASARNSGFMIDLPHNVGSSTEELAHAQTYRRLLQFGVSQLKKTVQTHNIDCHWSNTGKYHCAVTPQFDGLIDAYCAELNRLDEPHKVMEKAELASLLGTDFYRRAVYTPNCILVNPAALVRGLATSLPDNVTIYPNTPALNIDTHSGIRVQTPHGDIQASQLMLGMNGAIRGLLPGKSNVFAMATFATLTESLTTAQRQRLGDIQPWGLTPMNALAGATLRYTHDHRFLIREHVNFTPGLTTSVRETGLHARRHQALFNRLYPQLSDVAMNWSWSGMIGITGNGAPVWGKVAPHIYASAGCNGAGISKQSAFGHLLAEYALQQDHPLLSDMASVGLANWLPPRPVLDIGVKGYLARERWKARSEC